MTFKIVAAPYLKWGTYTLHFFLYNTQCLISQLRYQYCACIHSFRSNTKPSEYRFRAAVVLYLAARDSNIRPVTALLPPHTSCFALLSSVVHVPSALPFVRLHVGVVLCHVRHLFVRAVSLANSIITYTQIAYYRPKKKLILMILLHPYPIFCSYKIHSWSLIASSVYSLHL